MHNKLPFSCVFYLLGLVLSGLPLKVYSLASEPHWIELRILSRQTGEAIAGAAVCLGTTARPDQFGAERSDDNGRVRFEGLRGSTALVTISKQGFQGRQQVLEAAHHDRILELKIASGGGGPRCDAPSRSPIVDTSTGLSIENVSIRPDPATGAKGHVLVSIAVSGQANQVRISEQEGFAGASWRTFRSPLGYTLSQGTGLKRIYVQVRRFAQVKGASVEVISPVEMVKYTRE